MEFYMEKVRGNEEPNGGRDSDVRVEAKHLFRSERGEFTEMPGLGSGDRPTREG